MENFLKALFLGKSVGELSVRAKFFFFACCANLGLFKVGTLILGVSSSGFSSSFYLDFYLISGNYNLSDFSVLKVDVYQGLLLLLSYFFDDWNFIFLSINVPVKKGWSKAYYAEIRWWGIG